MSLNNPLAGLSPDQLTAVFQTMSTFYNLISAPPAPNDTPTHRSSRAATLAAAASAFPKLKEGAYSQWAFVVGDAIRSAGLWDYISGDIACPADRASKEYDLYLQESGVVRAVIVGALDPEKSFRYLGGTTTSKEAWDALKARYYDSDDAALRAIDEQLMGLRLEEGGNLAEHIALFKELKRELDDSDFEVNPTRAVLWMWRSLPPSYDHVVLRQQRSKVRDFDGICLELEAHYSNLISRSNTAITNNAASTSQLELTPYWNVPEDLRGLSLTGGKNPILAARASDTCWDCLGTGHEANTSWCNFYRYRIELWGRDAPNPNRPPEQQVNVAEAEPTTELGVAETAGPPSHPELPVPTCPVGGLDSPASSPSATSVPPSSFHPSPQAQEPTDSSPSPSTSTSFYSFPETDPHSNLSSPDPTSVSLSPIPASPSIAVSPSIPASPSTILASPSFAYDSQPTRPETPDGLRRAVQGLVGAVRGGDPLDHPLDWQGPPRRFPHTPVPDILETPEIVETTEPPETIDSQAPCVFEEFVPSEPLVFKDPQGTPGGTRMVNGEVLSALSLGRYSFAPWGENTLEDLLESLNASEAASPGGLGLMYEVLFPGGFFDLDAALPFSREIVDLFFGWYHAVRTHNGLKMELKRVCKCGAVTR
ncbi:unnamed protein product [Rhizoctonia solani]|uniref:Uncharacterized protein n=1 Tax=Rhizoctonia solani TaxID=456999 RepID=A0A8H3DHY1_9AGAM|nr:unnamed protein product [Rhizoctonia solani]